MKRYGQAVNGTVVLAKMIWCLRSVNPLSIFKVHKLANEKCLVEQNNTTVNTIVA